MSEWQPIDTAPKDRFILAGWRGSNHIEKVCWERNGWFGVESGYWQEKDYPTHWMPLPEPPK